MPRKRRTRLATMPVVPQVSHVTMANEDEERNVRTQVFEKTKMCKFHILGACAKGVACRFAHDQLELQNLPDLACTKLCKSLMATGTCTNPECRYAHSQGELRPMPFPQMELERDMPLAAGEVSSVRRCSSAMALALQKEEAAYHMNALMAQDDNGFYHHYLGQEWDTLHGEDTITTSDAYHSLGAGLLGACDTPQLRHASSAAARLCSLGDAEETEPARDLSLEPVQINLQSLRSMSGGNLVGMAAAEDTDDWVPDARPFHHSRHNSLDRLKESLQLDAPMTVQSQVNGLSPVLGELTEETKMNVAQFWQTQSRDSDSLFSDNYKLGPNQWVDETYFGDTFKAYPFSRGFDDAYYPAGLAVGSQ